MKSLVVYKKSISSNINIVGDVVEEMLKCIITVCGDVDECTRFELKVILNEILINAVKHGNIGDESKNINIKAYFPRQNVLSISVKDEGSGYNFRKTCSCRKPYGETDGISNMDESGRGILILKGLCDNIELNRKGNKIIVTKSITRI